jgi:hypothetical protein
MKACRITVQFIILLFFAGQSYGQQSYRDYHSQSKHEKRLSKKTYFLFGLPIMNLNLHQHYMLKSWPIDTVIDFKQKSSSSWSIGGGFFFNLIRLNDKNSIALDAGVAFSLYQWKVDKAKYASLAYDDANARSIMLEVPICIQYKHGGEATLNPKNKFLFSGGIGAAPTFTSNSYSIVKSGGFRFRPFVMVEAGMHFGMAMKIRAAYFPLSTTYIDVKGKALEGNEGTVSVEAKGTGNFVFSLIVLPASRHWGDHI